MNFQVQNILQLSLFLQKYRLFYQKRSACDVENVNVSTE